MKKLLIIIFSFIFTVGFSQSPGLKLWYKSPSGNTWENALPVGNGRLGAMVFGNVEKETLQLNEHTVWSGSPNRNDNPQALASLPEIRKLILKGDKKRPNSWPTKPLSQKNRMARCLSLWATCT